MKKGLTIKDCQPVVQVPEGGGMAPEFNNSSNNASNFYCGFYIHHNDAGDEFCVPEALARSMRRQQGAPALPMDLSLSACSDRQFVSHD